ncbi:MAG: cysteine desulfurase [Candidatus Altiarchaeota archaeon]|nr:cysteine desulfurase [Candidatus Altiarchaeota archaeon]
MKRVYMDHASTTPVDPFVLEAMLPYFSEKFGNASSMHSFGVDARRALDESRIRASAAINSNPDEIVFTSGGTESDNLAIKGTAYGNKKRHIITDRIEHKAVLNPCRFLEEKGFKVTYLPVDRYGLVDITEVEKSITKDTFLISVMHANNEIGTIQPIEEIGEIAADKGIIFHTDAVQTAGKLPLNMKKMNVDLLSISSHKLYGPKGVGALYVREGARLEPLIHGGGHEKNLRSGTENIPGIVGFSHALELSVKKMSEDSERLTRLRDRLIKGVLEVDCCRLNGHPKKRLQNNAHFTFPNMKQIDLVSELSRKNIYASAASACSAHSTGASHVLSAIGLTAEEACKSLRLTLGRINNEEDIEYVIEKIQYLTKNGCQITENI